MSRSGHRRGGRTAPWRDPKGGDYRSVSMGKAPREGCGPGHLWSRTDRSADRAGGRQTNNHEDCKPSQHHLMVYNTHEVPALRGGAKQPAEEEKGVVVGLREELARALARSTENAEGKDTPRREAVLLARAVCPVDATRPQLLHRNGASSARSPTPTKHVCETTKWVDYNIVLIMAPIYNVCCRPSVR
jgi:hypothetical protein